MTRTEWFSWRCVGAGLLAVALLSCHGSALAAYGVAVDVGPPKSAQPGDLVTHVFAVANVGTVADQFALTLTLPAGWTALPIAGQVGLAPGEVTLLFVTVMIPLGAEAGTYAIELRATSVGDPTQWADAEGIVDLLPAVDLALEVFRVDRASPGAEARHVVRVRNVGNVGDTYTVAARSTPDWTVHVTPDEFPLLPGAHRDVTIAVPIPRAAAPGTQYRLHVEARSQTNPALTRTLWVSAAVSPPPPDEVRVDLYPEIPLTFRLDMTEEGNPSFRFSLAGEIPGRGRVTASRSLGMLGMVGQDAGFHAADWGVDWGRVSVSGAFASLSGEGLRIQWNDTAKGASQLLLTDVGQGVAGSLEWERNTLRAVAVNVQGPPSYVVNELQLLGSFGESFSLSAVLAQGWTLATASEAFRIRPSMRVGEVAGFLELAEVSTDFPGQAARTSFGWGLSFGTGATPLQGGFSTVNTVALTDPGPPQVQTTTDGFTASFSARPTAQMLVSLTLAKETEESDDLPRTTDEGSLRLDLSLTDRGSTVTWLLTSLCRTTWDDVAGTQFVTTGVRFSVRASLGQVVTHGTANVELTQDLVNPGVFEASSSLTISCSLPRAPLAPTFGFSTGERGAALSASISWADIAGWKLSASLELPLAPRGGFSIGAAFTFPITFRLFGPTYGAIRGRAFVDVNGSGRFDAGDQPVVDLLLAAAGQQAITGRDGRFAFWPFLPGRYEVRIADLPFGLHPLVALPLRVDLKAGQEVELLIPFESRSLIRGTVFHDLNQDGVRGPGEPGVAGVQLLIANAPVRARVSTDAAGRFALEAPAGAYGVELLPESLPALFEPTTPTRVQVRVEERAFVIADFGIWQRPRPVIIAPVAPIARFEFTPSMPRVGQEVTFDASASHAIGEKVIVSYAWEFRMGAIAIQARGEKVTVVFERPGTWLVTLRVTDSSGQTAQAQRTVAVH